MKFVSILKLFVFVVIFLSQFAHAELKIYWTGVAGIYFTDGKHGVYFDPVFHRPSFLDVIFKKEVNLDEEFVKKMLSKLGDGPVDAIFVTHSHHDHFYDAPIIAKLKKSKIYGSKTTQLISQTFDLAADRIIDLNNGYKVTVGDFTIEAVATSHGKILGIYKFQFGELTEMPKKPLKISDYLVGEPYSYILTYQGKKYLIQQASSYTQNLLDRIKNENFEYIIQGLGGRKSSTDLADNIWGIVKTNAIVPMHHDNFFSPLRFDEKGEGIFEFLIGINYPEFLEVTKKRSYKVIEPRLFHQFN